MKECQMCGTENEEYNVYCYACGYLFTSHDTRHDDGEAKTTGEDM